MEANRVRMRLRSAKMQPCGLQGYGRGNHTAALDAAVPYDAGWQNLAAADDMWVMGGCSRDMQIKRLELAWFFRHLQTIW